MGILNIDLKNINLDNNFDEDYLDTIILIRVLAWHSKSEKRKALKKLKWRIIINSVASLKMVEVLHIRRWENRNQTNFYEGVVKVYVDSIQYRSI